MYTNKSNVFLYRSWENFLKAGRLKVGVNRNFFKKNETKLKSLERDKFYDFVKKMWRWIVVL